MKQAVCVHVSGQGSGGGKSVKLTEGELSNIKVEVTAEDGTTKTYWIHAKRLSAKDATLAGIEIKGTLLNPPFSPNVSEYFGWSFVIIIYIIVQLNHGSWNNTSFTGSTLLFCVSFSEEIGQNSFLDLLLGGYFQCFFLGKTVQERV